MNLYKQGFDFSFTQDEIQATMERNREHFTMYKPEDAFLAECLLITGNAGDFISSAEMEGILNTYRHEHHVREYLSMSTVRAKLKAAGVTDT